MHGLRKHRRSLLMTSRLSCSQRIDHGTLACEPKSKPSFSSLTKVGSAGPRGSRAAGLRWSRGRGIAQQATARSSGGGDADGAGQRGRVDCRSTTFLKELRTRREDAHRVLAQVTAVCGYAGALISAGATVIAIGDPTATVEILGPQLFQEYAIRYLNDLAASIHALGTRSSCISAAKMGAGLASCQG